ncbi:MAG: glycosyltransferase family 4 protein [Clostridiaceae bacterium]|nr:glycosyltransferase family 4 protein [Clostridiaceae bacterium]
MKVLIIHNSYKEYGGEDKVVESQVKLFKEREIDYITYFCNSNEIDNYTAVQKLLLLKNGYASINTKNNIERLIEEHKPDVAHVHNVYPLISPIVYSVLKKHKIPIVQTIHNFRFICPNSLMFNKNRICEKCLIKDSYYQCFFNKCYRQSYFQSFWYSNIISRAYKKGWLKNVDRFIVFHEFMREKLVEKGFERSKITILPNFTEASGGEINQAKEDYFLFIGRLSEEKGISTLLRAANNADGSIKLYIVGDGPLKEKVINFASEHKEKVKYLGFKSGREKEAVIRNAKAVIVPSEWYENFPTVILESFSLGTTVIGSNIGGIPYMIKNGVNGLVFEPGNEQELNNKIKLINSDDRLLSELSVNAVKSYLSNYTKEKYFEGIKRIYAKIN